MFKKKDKDVVDLTTKESEQKKPTNKKKLLIGGGIAVVGVIGVLAFTMLRSESNYLTLTDDLLSQHTGSFRYVFDIRTDEHSDASTEESVTDISDLENIEADMDVDQILEEYQEDKKEFVSWGNKEGVEVVNWEYPKYKIVLEGNVVSTEPLEMSLSVSLATNYFNDTLTDFVVKDGKTYANIEQLRYWLVNSKDENLISLGLTLPESAKYVMYEGDAFNLYSTFAEESEVDLSRESNIMILLNRLLVTEKSLVPKLAIDGDCLSESNDIYKLNVTGDNSVSLLNSIKSMVLNVGSTYKNTVSNQYNNKLLTDEQYNQALRETDNIVDAFSDLNLFFSTADLKDLGLQVSGNAREYTGGKGSTIYESSLALQFTANNTDYSISVQLHKDSAIEDVRVPNQSSADISTYKDTDFVEKYMVQVLNYLNITGVRLENQLEVSPTSIKDNAISSFVTLVNDINRGKEGFTEINTTNVFDFIEGYRDYKVTDETSDLERVNATLVSDLLAEFKVLTPQVEEEEDTDASLKDESRFPSLIADTDNFRIYADFDRDTSNTRCVIVRCYVLNKTGEELQLTTSDFSLRTIQSSKYPANYQALLREYDNQFDMANAPEQVTLGANSYIEMPLYFILSNGLEYMDLWYGETNLGVVMSR